MCMFKLGVKFYPIDQIDTLILARLFQMRFIGTYDNRAVIQYG